MINFNKLANLHRVFFKKAVAPGFKMPDPNKKTDSTPADGFGGGPMPPKKLGRK